MRHVTRVFCLLLVCAATAGCGSNNNPTNPTEPTPVPVTETFDGTVTVNGARTHSFVVNRAGTASAQLTGLSDGDAVIGLSLGTWNGASCQIWIANDAAVLNVAVVGTAQNSGQFCARVYDVGLLNRAVDYVITVTHF